MTDAKPFHAPHLGPREVVYENRYQQIYQVTANFGDFVKEYFVTDTGQRAGVVIAQGELVLLVRQYRLLIDRLSWEIPGGKVDDGETPEVAAVRECEEETGLHCRNLKPLIYFHPGLDTNHNPTHLFSTDEFIVTPGANVYTHEVSECVWIPLAQCIPMIYGRQIVDSLSIIALLAYHTLAHL
jgi:8-oxo-dGTP pyrophosphatase MutT (NUDIX family)